ncbi:uncharacterized protein BKCO1_3300037 [Diplodia corticola]|uniref:BTB domain-containing protein n=1 Tax=Diplodia corticola TaxID=236234 RepID=A0A1J9S0B0_9PEZI|nr:uncharacterized protein BKCO1_3300037 [Diplodia corticola]OJD33117.1 hypothetical protein BKCO1_3300037 [Diplodia corticola]
MATVSQPRPNEIYELDPKGDVILLLAVPHHASGDSEPEIPQEEEKSAEAVAVEAAEKAAAPSSDFYTPVPESDQTSTEAAPEWPAAEESAPPSSIDEYPEEYEKLDDPPPPEPEPEYQYSEPYEPSTDAPPPDEQIPDIPLPTEQMPSDEHPSPYSQPPSPPPPDQPIPEAPPPPSAKEPSQGPPSPTNTLRILASSSILRLASPHFAHLLSSTTTSPQDSSPAPAELDFTALPSPSALLTLLHIFHFRTRAVPRAVSLEQLAQIAQLVAELGCHDAVSRFADDWIRRLQDTLPTEVDGFGAPARRWMSVAWVFRREREWRVATRVAQRCARRPLGEGECVAVPKSEIDHLNRTRSHALTRILHALHAPLAAYTRSHARPRCSDACDSLVLGALTRRLHARGLLAWLPGLPVPVQSGGDGDGDGDGDIDVDVDAASGVVEDFSVRGLARWVEGGLDVPSVHGLVLGGGGGSGGGGWNFEGFVAEEREPEGEQVPEPEQETGVVEEFDGAAAGSRAAGGDEWGVWGTSMVRRRRRGRGMVKGRVGGRQGGGGGWFDDDSTPPGYDEVAPPPPPPAPEVEVEVGMGMGNGGGACDPLREMKARVAEIAAGFKGLELGV